MKPTFAILILLYLIPPPISAQQQDSLKKDLGFIENGDTLVFRNVKEVVVFPNHKFKNKRQYRRYTRYIRKVKKVYPLAVEARKLLKKYEPRYYALEEKRDRRKLMKQLEKELLAEHKEELKASFEGKKSDHFGRLLVSLENYHLKENEFFFIYVDGKYGQYGLDQQELFDGSHYLFELGSY